VVDIFVSEKFKSRVLEHSLTGFDLRPAIIA
jgi:hypothetical protein